MALLLYVVTGCNKLEGDNALVVDLICRCILIVGKQLLQHLSQYTECADYLVYGDTLIVNLC